MRKLTAALSLAAVLAGCAVLVFATTSTADEAKAESGDVAHIDWQPQLPEAADKPLMVYFTATWCGPCQTMKKEAWSNDAVVKAASPYTPVMIDIDEQPEVAEAHNLDGVPTVILMSKDGQELDRMVGYGPGMQGKVAAFLSKNAPKE